MSYLNPDIKVAISDFESHNIKCGACNHGTLVYWYLGNESSIDDRGFCGLCKQGFVIVSNYEIKQR